MKRDMYLEKKKLEGNLYLKGLLFNIIFLIILIIGMLNINYFNEGGNSRYKNIISSNQENDNFQVHLKEDDIEDSIHNSQYGLLEGEDSHTQIQNSILYLKFLNIGHHRTFWLLDFNNWSYYKINATLISIGEKCYIYMEDYCIRELGDQLVTEKGERICNEFDYKIYPRVIDLAGNPNGTLGDIDGDPRIIILLSHNPISYYDQRNELQLDYSNLCEMFHIYYKTWTPTIAHEFHHLIWFNNEMDEPHFTLEALAEYSTYHAGYLTQYNNLNPQSSFFLAHPEDSLLYWNMLNSVDYGGAYLFAFYIAEHYGVSILKNLIKEPTDGANGIQNVLKFAGYNITFNELYMNWITALTLDEIGFMSNLYGFVNLDARVTKYTNAKFPLTNNKIKLYYYGFDIQKIITPQNNFTIEIQKDQDKTIGVSIAFHDDIGWHIIQNLNNKGIKLITENIFGLNIEELYLITSYIFDQIPPLPTENGLGPYTYIEISTSNLKEDPAIIFLTITGSSVLGLIICIIFIIRYHLQKKIE